MIRKLYDEEMNKVIGGGVGDHDGIVMLGLVTSVAATPVALGCSIARMVKSSKAQKVMLKGDTFAAEEYSESIKKLDIAAVTSSALACSGLVALIGGCCASA